MANYFTDDRVKPADGFIEHIVKPNGVASNIFFILVKNILFWGSVAISIGLLFLLI